MMTAGDQLYAPLWLAVTAAIALASWRVSKATFPGDSVIESLLHSVIIGCATVVGVATAVGTVGALRPYALLAAGSVAAGFLFVLARWRSGRERDSCRPAERAATPDRPGFLLLWVAVGLCWTSHVVVEGLLELPTDFDTLAYHLPMVDSWLQANSLFAPDCDHWSTPGNHALISLWCVAPFSGDFLAPLNNLPTCLALAFAVFTLCRALAVRPALAHLTALLAVNNGIVWNQLIDNENDVAVAAYFAACLAYSHRYAVSLRPADLVLASVSLGLLAGVKFYASGYAVLAAVTLVGVAWGRGGSRVALRAALVALAGGLALGGSWYARNLIIAGSPLYPRDFLRGPDTLSLLYPGWQTSSFLGNGDPRLIRLGLRAVWQMIGPYQFAAVALLPILLLGLLAESVSWWRSGGRQAAIGRLALAAQAGGAVGLWLVTPFAVEDIPNTLNQIRLQYCPMRYGLAAVVAATVCLTVVLNDILHHFHAVPDGEGPRRGAAAALAGLAPHTLLVAGIVIPLLVLDERWGIHPSRLGWPVLALTAVVANVWLLSKSAPRLRLCLTPLWGLVAFGLGVAGIWHLSEKWHRDFVPHFNKLVAFGLLDKVQGLPPADTRVCVLDFRSYPFFGSARQYRVCQPVYVSSPEALRAYLQARQVTLIVTPNGPHPRSGCSFEDLMRYVAGDKGNVVKLSPPAPLALYHVTRPTPTSEPPKRSVVALSDDSLGLGTFSVVDTRTGGKP